jgi:hypothetical protein
MVVAPLSVILAFSVRVDELVRDMLAAETVALPAMVAVPLAVMAPLKVVPPFNVAVLLPANVSEAAVMEQVVLDVSVELAFRVMALVPVTTPGPSKLRVAAEVVPTVVVPVIINVIPGAKVSVTVTPFAIFNVAIDPCDNAETEIDVLVLMSAMSLVYEFPG